MGNDAYARAREVAKAAFVRLSAAGDEPHDVWDTLSQKHAWGYSFVSTTESFLQSGELADQPTSAHLALVRIPGAALVELGEEEELDRLRDELQGWLGNRVSAAGPRADARVRVHPVSMEKGQATRPLQDRARGPVRLAGASLATVLLRIEADIGAGEMGEADLHVLGARVYPQTLWPGRTLQVRLGAQEERRLEVMEVHNPILSRTEPGFDVRFGGETLLRTGPLHIDEGMGVRMGPCAATYAFEKVRPVFELFHEACALSGEAQEERLEDYYDARDALELEVWSTSGERLEEVTVHVEDHRDELEDETEIVLTLLPSPPPEDRDL